MSDYDVVVIGAGLGGLSSGALLAKQGRKVLILEQSERVGGCCSTFEKDGFHFDLGASLIEAADQIDLAFRRLGTSLQEQVNLVSVDPVYSVIMKDGTRLKYPLSSDETARQIGKIAAKDQKGWYKYFNYMNKFLDNAFAGGFFQSPTNTLGDMSRLIGRAPGLIPFLPMFLRSYQDEINRFFKDARVRESVGYQTFYLGLPPELCPGYAAMLACLERRGMYYSKGGMIQIPAALQRCGEKYGVKVKLNTRVKRVMLNRGKAMGVALTDGTEITSDIVVSDINAKQLYLNMIGEEHLPWLVRKGLKSYEYSMAVPMMYLGVDYKPPLESHHTLATLPMNELNDFWWNVYKKGYYPTEQFGIISWTSASDPSLAPPGHHVICLTLAPGPYKLKGSDWDKEKPRIQENIINYYSKKYIPGLAEHVKVAEFGTPLDFERRLLSPEGAIYGLRQDVTSITVFRPSSKSKCIKGLYLAGASTCAGGGVPSTILSGIVVADLVEKHEKK